MHTQPAMVPGRVYRTRELRAFSANPSRWAKRLVERGVLRQPYHGLFYMPVQSRFGPVAAMDEELLRAFLGTGDFLITGPYVWNALGLGTTQLFAVTVVYNGERTGEVELGGRRFWFRRVRFPKDPPPEWYVVDLLQNERWMPEDTSRLDEHLVRAAGRIDAISRRWSHADLPARSFVRHYEDAARIVEALPTLPPVQGGLDVLVTEMLAERQLRVRPLVEDPAFVLAPGERTDEVRAAWEHLRPLFWGARVPVDEAGAQVRRRILANLPPSG